MSKLVDKLQSLSKSSTPPIGFHPSVSELKKTAMLLIVGLSRAQVKEAKIVADVNADAGLISDQGLSATSVKQIIKVVGNIPMGVFVKDISAGKIDEFVDLGCDFVIFDVKVASTILHKEEIGKILMIEPSLDQGFIRAINSLEVDGVLISRGGEEPFQGSGGTAPSATVAVEHLLVCRRFVELLEKPIMMTLPPSVTKTELTSLWQAGVDGVVVSSAQSVETLAELKKTIGDLPRGARGRRAKVGVMLPHYGGFVTAEEDEDEEEI